MEPIGNSQIVAYIKRLKEISFVIISFEKPVNLKNKDRVRALGQEIKDHGIRWIPMRYHKRMRLVATAWDIARGVAMGLYVYLRYGYEIIHSRSLIASVIAYVLKTITRTALIYDVRSFWSDERASTLRKGPVYFAIKAMEKKLLIKADQVVVLAESARKHLMSFGLRDNTKVSVIPCCVDTHFRYTEEGRQRVRSMLCLNGKFVVLHAGSLENLYMADKMFECFAAIQEKMDNAVFLLLTSMDNQTLTTYVKQFNIPSKSVILTLTNHSLMAEYISAADVGLFFLKTPPAAAGISPVKLGEYISCYLPIISNTGIGDMDMLFSKYKTGYLIHEHNHNSYLIAIDEILRIKSNWNDFVKNCEQTIQHELSINLGVKKYLNIYNNLSS